MAVVEEEVEVAGVEATIIQAFQSQIRLDPRGGGPRTTTLDRTVKWNRMAVGPEIRVVFGSNQMQTATSEAITKGKRHASILKY